MTYIVLVGR